MTDYDTANDNGDESYRNEETLRRLYWGEEMSMRDMAKRLGCSKTTIRDWMGRCGIESRPRSEDQYSGLDEQTLKHLYYSDEKSAAEIANQFGCSESTVLDRMERCGVERRSQSEAQPNQYPGLDGSTLDELYREDHLSMADIADRFGCSPSTVFERCKEYGIEIRSISEWGMYLAARAPAPFGVNGDGYERWRVYLDGQRHQIFAHRLLAVSEFGFDAVCGMDVHHENEVPWDNRPSNLRLMEHGEHSRHHALENRGKNESTF